MNTKVTKMKDAAESTTRRGHGSSLSINDDSPDEQLRMLATRVAAIGSVFTDCSADLRQCSMAVVGLGGILADYADKLDEIADRVMEGGAV